MTSYQDPTPPHGTRSPVAAPQGARPVAVGARAGAVGGERGGRRGGWWWLPFLLVGLVGLAIVAAALGWFDSDAKRSRPSAPKAPVPTVTSSTPSGAAAPADPAPAPAAAGAATTPSGPVVTALAHGLVGGAAVAPTPATGQLGVRGSVGDVLFPESGASLDGDAQAVIAEAAKEIRQDHATAVTVTGYTDGIGDPVANQQLSVQRAQAVLDALRAQLGSAVTFNAAAYGPTQPVATNATPSGRQLNRRVAITAT